MSENAPYDDWAPIYDVWVDTAPVTARNLPFFVRRLVDAPGPAVELGVGNGRIAIEAAKQGARLTGVDSSSAMLALCRQRAREAGVASRISLIKADFRDFRLPEPAALVVIPFHSIGHLLTLDDKRACLANIHAQLTSAGQLIFDHFVFDTEYARVSDGVTRLRGEYVDPESGRDTLLWVTVRYVFEEQRLHILATSEEVDPLGEVTRRRLRRLDFSWLHPEQARSLLEETGYEVEALWGDFDESPFGEESREQIWVARRP